MRLAIVNDLPIAVEAIRRALATTNEHHIAWVARDGAEAVRLCAQDPPHLVLMDLLMPVMDGVEATRRIMAASPCAILVVTATVEGNTARVYEALSAGALDAVNTPVLGGGQPSETVGALLRKIDLLGRLIAVEEAPPERRAAAANGRRPRESLVAIGASAGGPGALATVLSGLPHDFGASVVIIQHVDERFAQGLAEWLDGQSRLPVRLAREGDAPSPGQVLLAGGEDHLVFTSARRLGYTPHPRENPYRPSVDAFYHSVVTHWRGEVVGVLLTGMGRDGAAGLKALREAGHFTVAQDRGSSAVYGMPKAAAALGAAVEILPLTQIASALRKRLVNASGPAATEALPL